MAVGSGIPLPRQNISTEHGEFAIQNDGGMPIIAWSAQQEYQ
jgi:hypothetical protein